MRITQINTPKNNPHFNGLLSEKYSESSIHLEFFNYTREAQDYHPFKNETPEQIEGLSG